MKNDGPRATPEIVAMLGKRFITASETSDGRKLDEGRVKQLTGETHIPARQLYGRQFDFDLHAKFVLSFNHKPIVTDDTYAFWRRFKLITFPMKFYVDKTSDEAAALAVKEGVTHWGLADKYLEARLLAEAPGILNWALAGHALWRADGLCEPPVVTEATEAYRQDEDPLAEFFSPERFLFEPSARLQAAVLYKTYEAWAVEAGIPDPMGSSAFGRRMNSRYARTTLHGTRYYKGIGLIGAPVQADAGLAAEPVAIIEVPESYDWLDAYLQEEPEKTKLN